MATAPPNSTEFYEKILAANLQRTLDFLKFAEAKNAALLALGSGWVFALINLAFGGKTMPVSVAVGIGLALPFSLISALLAMLSFLPRLHLPSFLGGRRAGRHTSNLLYFGDISTLPVKTLAHEFKARYFATGPHHTDDYIHDLVVQISVNSDITMRKMRLFRYGIILILLSGLILLVPALIVTFNSAKGLW